MGWGACHDTIGLYRDRQRQLERLNEVCHDTSNCIVTGAWVGHWVVVSRYNNCIVTSGQFRLRCVTIQLIVS